MKKITGLFLFVFYMLCFDAHAEVRASVDKNTVGLRENVVLNIQSDGTTSAQPDLSVLKNLFNVVSTSVSRQTYIVNGQAGHEITWKFILTPLQKGKLIIEPITVGNEKTNPVEVSVSETGASAEPDNQNAQTTQPIYEIDAQIISPLGRKPFIQEQMDYKVRVIDDGALQIESIGFDEAEDFIVREMAKPTVQKLQNGKREIVFSYALFALKSGLLQLPKAHVQGFVYQQPEVENFFQNNMFMFQMPSVFGVQTPITLVSDEKNVEILPAPQEYHAKWWLPAKNVSIEGHFTNKPQIVRVGNILKREVLIKAVGLTGEQLPQIEMPASDTAKQYPEKPRMDTEVSGSEVIGKLYVSDVYIPQKTGEITLPEIKIDWYDVNTNEIKTAVLKKDVIRVFQNTNLKEDKGSLSEKNAQADSKIAPQAKKNNPYDVLYNEYVLFALAFVGGMFVCYLMVRPKKEKTKPEKEKIIEEKDIFSTVKKNDLKALRDRIVLWAQTNYKEREISNLNDVAALLGDKDFNKAAEELLSALYSDEPREIFNVKAFQKIFKKALKNRKKASKENNTPIPPLYS